MFCSCVFYFEAQEYTASTFLKNLSIIARCDGACLPSENLGDWGKTYLKKEKNNNSWFEIRTVSSGMMLNYMHAKIYPPISFLKVKLGQVLFSCILTFFLLVRKCSFIVDLITTGSEFIRVRINWALIPTFAVLCSVVWLSFKPCTCFMISSHTIWSPLPPHPTLPSRNEGEGRECVQKG